MVSSPAREQNPLDAALPRQGTRRLGDSAQDSHSLVSRRAMPKLVIPWSTSRIGWKLRWSVLLLRGSCLDFVQGLLQHGEHPRPEVV